MLKYVWSKWRPIKWLWTDLKGQSQCTIFLRHYSRGWDNTIVSVVGYPGKVCSLDTDKQKVITTWTCEMTFQFWIPLWGVNTLLRIYVLSLEVLDCCASENTYHCGGCNLLISKVWQSILI